MGDHRCSILEQESQTEHLCAPLRPRWEHGPSPDRQQNAQQHTDVLFSLAVCDPADQAPACAIIHAGDTAARCLPTSVAGNDTYLS